RRIRIPTRTIRKMPRAGVSMGLILAIGLLSAGTKFEFTAGFLWRRTCSLSGSGGSPLEPAAVEERLLLGSCCAPEHGVAVGEAPEAANNVGVQLGPFEHCSIAELTEQPDATLLVRQRFTVLERHIEELALVWLKRQIKTMRNRPIGHRPRQRIGGERARIIAKHVAGKLVEHDYKGERTLGGRFPVMKAAGGRSLVGRKELGADRGIESVVACKPPLRAG